MKGSILFLPLLLASSAFAVAPVSLERTTKVGDTGMYTLAFDFKLPTGSGTFKGNSTEVTKSATADGYEIERTYKDVVITAEGLEFPQNMPPYILSFSKDGGLKHATGDEVGPDTVRFMRLWTFVAAGKPVESGASWTYAEVEDKDAGKPAFEATFTMDGKDAVAGFDVAKVSYTAKESGELGSATAKGTFWIRLTDGATVKVDSEVKDAPNAGQKLDGHIVYSLKPAS